MNQNTTLLASDLDGTLIPLKENKRALSAIEVLRDLLDVKQVHLTYVTGRHLELALQGASSLGLPIPEMIITDVGTTVWIRENDEWSVEPGYAQALAEAWNGRSGSELAPIIDDLPMLELQEADRQGRFKRSYCVPLKHTAEEVKQAVEGRLKREGIRAALIYSVDPLTNTGLLDVLPPGASKLSALNAMCKRFGISAENMVYAGDSGNDVEVFLSGCRSILVSNTPPEIMTAVQSHAANHGFADRIYIAKEPYTAGVLEGCRHFGLIS